MNLSVTKSKNPKKSAGQTDHMHGDRKRSLLRIILIVIPVLFLAFLSELAFQIPALRDSYNAPLPVTSASHKGCELDGDSIVCGAEKSSVTFRFDKQYVGKFYFSFEREAADKLADFQISVHSYNVFGTEEIVEYTDQNPNLIHTSTINLHKEADEITIRVPEGLDGLKITNAGIKNEFQFSKERFFFFLALYALIAFLFFSRSAWAKKVESRFLVFTLVIGTVFVSVLPISKVGWDEEIHFNRAYTLPITRTAKLTPTLHEYTAVSLTNWPYNLPQSKEEKVELFGSLDTLADYRSPEAIEISNKPNLTNFYNLHYIPQALGIKAGQLLHLNFGYVYMLGRWCNLLAYAVIMYFAIKKLPIGKRLMAAIGLMPTPIFLASTYSYDAMIIAGITFGFAYLLAELLDRKKPLETKNFVFFVVSIAVASLAKAIYIPLVLMGLLIPKDKYKNKKQRTLCRLAVIGSVLLLIGTFILPSFIAPPATGDVRGGDTNRAAQLALVLSQPISYLGVWFENFSSTIVCFTLGPDSLAFLGHLATSPCVHLIMILMIVLILTDTAGLSNRHMNIKEKGVLTFLLLAIAGMIWSALYLDFTEVGRTTIAGVQGRYYLPLLFPLFSMFLPVKLRTLWNERKYDLAVFAVIACIEFKTIYDCVLVPFNI